MMNLPVVNPSYEHTRGAMHLAVATIVVHTPQPVSGMLCALSTFKVWQFAFACYFRLACLQL